MRKTAQDAELRAAAAQARRRAYAPYSSFKVGAALRLRDGRVISGANVENCSYGLTMCAERNAIAAAVIGGAKPGDIVAVAIVTRATSPSAPCGACRQVLAEFCGPATRVLMHNLADGRTLRRTLRALLPWAFRPENMPRR